MHSARRASSKSTEHEITIKIPGSVFCHSFSTFCFCSFCVITREASIVLGALFTAHRFLKLSHAASTSGICITTRESFVIYDGRCHKHGSIDYSFDRSRRYPPSQLQSLPVLCPSLVPPKRRTRCSHCALCIPAASLKVD